MKAGRIQTRLMLRWKDTNTLDGASKLVVLQDTMEANRKANLSK